MCLEKLSKKHKKWISMALKICGDEDYAKDVVQEAYIRLYNFNKKNPKAVIEDTMVWVTIRNIIIDEYRIKNKIKKIEIEKIYNLSNKEHNFELSDKDLLYIKRAKKFRYIEKGLLELNYDKSIREISKETSINYWFIYKILNKTRKLILRDDFEKKYKNKRLKYKKNEKK